MVIEVSQTMPPAVCERMSQDGMPCQSQAREGCGFVEDGRCGAMLLRQLQCIGRTMLWCKTNALVQDGVHHMGEQRRGGTMGDRKTKQYNGVGTMARNAAASV